VTSNVSSPNTKLFFPPHRDFLLLVVFMIIHFSSLNVSTRSHLWIAAEVSPIPIRLYVMVNGFKEVKWGRLKRISF
jgi:hypothetical protein